MVAQRHLQHFLDNAIDLDEFLWNQEPERHLLITATGSQISNGNKTFQSSACGCHPTEKTEYYIAFKTDPFTAQCKCLNCANLELAIVAKLNEDITVVGHT